MTAAATRSRTARVLRLLLLLPLAVAAVVIGLLMLVGSLGGERRS